MLYREIIDFCYEIHAKYVNTMCGQNIEFFNVKPGGTWSNHLALNGWRCDFSFRICVAWSENRRSRSYVTQVLAGLVTAVFDVAGPSFAFIGSSAEFQASFLVSANELQCHCAEPLTSTRQLVLADKRLTIYVALRLWMCHVTPCCLIDRYQRIGGYFSRSYNQHTLIEHMQ